ncbi:MAG: hypothetical protein J7604_16915 [Sporocytophaga sp.]|uniref:hypothetical protein n=1 Tax=Sporocytophaga sp. TaxID=2231183 RepID=UPI001B18827F|nr:hypothetical protein [Sporocytophaga sp.]MBO9701892.1 hypothetical protein [Sporocytophaga sp.]
MKKCIPVAILGSLLFINVRCSMKKSITSDLNNLCELANKINKEGNSSRSDLGLQFLSEANKLELSYETRKFLNELAIQKNKVSYVQFTDFAARNEIENFHCKLNRGFSRKMI